MEQTREPMDKNRIGGIRRRASEHMIAKPISIKDVGCKSGGCARKAVELTSGDLPLVVETRLRAERSAPKSGAEVSSGHSTPKQSVHSIEALVRKERNGRTRRTGNDRWKAQTVPRKRLKGVVSRRRDS